MTYGFIGAGNMATAMMKGLLHANVDPADIYVSSPHRAKSLAEELHINAADSQTVIDHSDIVVLAFLPNQLTEIGATLNFTNKIVVSVLAQITIADLNQAIPNAFNVRALPNINSAIGQGNTALAFADNIDAAQNKSVIHFWKLLGNSVTLEEEQFAIFSAIAGSGPAYVFKFIDALTKAGVANGLEETQAASIATQTVLGSASTLNQSDSDAATLMNSVASPGGSTRAGLDNFEANQFDDVVAKAILATVNHKHA